MLYKLLLSGIFENFSKKTLSATEEQFYETLFQIILQEN